MKSPVLVKFLQAVSADPALQAQCGLVQNLAELLALAQAAGFTLNPKELQLWAHDKAFDAPWWPWAEADAVTRVAFFRGES